MNFKYEIALSFAGEDREIANALATELLGRGIKVFYDRFEMAKLWGKDLIEHLYNVYAKEAKYCVILISKYYVDKAWPTHERRSAQERALDEGEYILPIKVDESDLPGLPSTVCYIRSSDYSIFQIADMISNKLGLPTEEATYVKPEEQPTFNQIDLREVSFDFASDSRFLRHETLSGALLPLKNVKGYFALQSLAPTGTVVSEDRLSRTFLDTTRIYSESLSYAVPSDVHPDGYTRRYECQHPLGHTLNTQATTCYYDGHIITEGYLDPLLENPTGFNPMWFMYKVQRHLQLTKEVIEGCADVVFCIVILKNIEEVEWEVYRGHKVAKLEPYVGYHRDIVVNVHLSDVHGREQWNMKMPLVEEVMLKIARAFSMNRLPQPYWDGEGLLLYPQGFPGR